MTFIAFKEFRGSIKDVVLYLTTELKKILRDLQLGLTRLTLEDNFESFKVNVSIPATSEVAIRNRLDVIPSERIILRSDSSTVVDGDTTWNENYVFLKNTGASAANVTVIFMK